MNATLKSIQQLIHHANPGIQLAAIRVLTAIHAREADIHKSIGDLLLSTKHPEVFNAALEAIEFSPHEHILRHLIRLLDKEGDFQDRVVDAIARIGPKAIPPLKQQFERVSPETQRRIVRVLSRIRNHHAHSFLVDCLAHHDHQLVRETVRALREEIGTYSAGESSDLYLQINSALKDKRFRQNEAALSAAVISLGIIRDPRAQEKLLELVGPGHTQQIRRHALMSLACLSFPPGPNTELAEALYPLLDEQDYDGLVKHAIGVLTRMDPAKKDQDMLRNLLANAHTGVRVFAARKLASLDSAVNARLILDLLQTDSQELKEAAVESLSAMPSAAGVALKAVEEGAMPRCGGDLLKILASHPNRIPPEKARARIRKLLEERPGGGDRQSELMWEAMKRLRSDVMREEILAVADAAFEKGDYETAGTNLQLLDGSDLLTPELRYKLMLASLKTSDKNLSRGSRASDVCLEHAARLLDADPRGFKQRLLSEPILDDTDYLYLGFHFSGRLNAERRFGAEILQYVAAKWPRRQSAKAARQKLQVEGR